MPPKPKCSREEIALAAFEIVKTDGVSALTARNLGKKLGTSVSPVFTVFKNMGEVKMAARELALKEFIAFIGDYQCYTPAFKRIGMMMVSFSLYEPEMFKLLFMQEHSERQDFLNTISDLGEVADVCKELISKQYGFSQQDAALLFEQMWIYAFGLGAMCAMKVCSLSEEEIGQRLGMMFAGSVNLIQSGKMENIFPDVEKDSDGEYHGASVKTLSFLHEAPKN